MMNLAALDSALTRVRLGVAMALCIVGAPAAWAQGTITGRVTAAGSGEPLPATRVIAVGTNSSATTGQDGKYTLKHVPPGTVEVQVLRVGYQSRKKTVTLQDATTSAADFDLVPTIAKLAEVVSTGTGEQRKIELGYTTTALNDIGTRTQQTPTILTVGDLLTQRAASVNVLGEGMVGTAASIRLRGLNSFNQSNEPIIMVDGARVASNALTPGAGVGGTQTSLLNSFTPEDIESIEIVKGPAAATIYGTNAANGVILITTKKGRVGDPRWTWTAEEGRIKDENAYPSSFAIWGHAPSSSAPIRCLLPTMGSSTCIQDSVTSLNILEDPALTPLNTGRRRFYGMQVNGGSDVVRFFISGNIENALGPVQMPAFAAQRLDSMLVDMRGEWRNPEALQRENFRANFNATLTQSLELGATAGFVKSSQRFPQTDNSPVGLLAAARESPGFAHAGLGYTNTGALGENLHGYNLWIPSEIFQDLNTQEVQRQSVTASLSWHPLAWMQNDVVSGIDYATYSDVNICRLNECPAFSSGGIALRNGSAYSKTSDSRVVTTKASSISTWNAKPNVNVRTSVGTEWTYLESDNSLATGIGLPPGAQNTGQGATRTGATNLSETAGKTWGVFAQSQAAIRDRLFVTVGLRSDQNSAFGPKLRWVNYPKANVSWVLSDEDFFPKLSWLDQFRARTAYGVSALQPSLTTSFKTYRPFVSNLGGTDQQGLVADQVGNPNLRPERTGEFELGFDSRVLKNRVNVELTYFSKKTTDAIVVGPVAASSASPSLTSPVNVGAVQNSGLEAVVTTQLADRRSFAWDLTVTASHGTNKVTAVGPAGTLQFGNTWIAEGFPIDALFYRRYTFADASADGRIQPSEVTVDSTMRYAGYQMPRDLVSLQNGFDLFARRLRVTALIDYKGGHSVFDASNAFLCQQFLSCPDESDPSSSLTNQARAVAARYGTTIGGTPFTTAAGYLGNGQFWRFRELTATWMLPENVTRRFLRAIQASVNVGARNLHVWTHYSGVDPESNFGAGDLQNDFMTAGPPRYYTLRLNLHY